MPLSVREQDARMRAEFPGFRLTLDLGFMGVWEGSLTPVCQTYTIRITYFARVFFENYMLANPVVSIVVLDPHNDLALDIARFRENATNDRLVYINSPSSTRPFCGAHSPSRILSFSRFACTRTPSYFTAFSQFI